MNIEIPTQRVTCSSLIGGVEVAGAGPSLEVTSPYTGTAIAEISLCRAADVERAVAAAHSAWPAWRGAPLRERIEPLLRLRSLISEQLEELALGAALESGKTPGEARAGLMRGIEVIDFAAALHSSDRGAALDVSRGVSCEYRREPLGVVVGITPFNFPAMVPMWMFPLALTLGNAFVLKPSEKVPMSALRLAKLALAAGYPPGVFSVIQGDRETVEALTSHPLVRAVAFVGSSEVAQRVYSLAATAGKRALCLGGAKNHLIVAPDADPALTVRAVVDSFTGCAGQRCMAGSVMIAVGAGEQLIAPVMSAAAAIALGSGMGALIDRSAKARLESAIEHASRQGAVIALDGRRAAVPPDFSGGHWLGPTILDHVKPEMECARTELFGPVLCVVRVPTLEAALEFERQSPYGNATSIFTSSGAAARHVREQASSGMIGINVGVPVPREPFSFGGTKRSKFGHGDITGPGALDFWTDLKKITTKWAPQTDATWMS